MKLVAFLKSMSPLSIALGVSIAIHAVLLSVRFIAPEQFNRVFQDNSLEVILVNAHTQEHAEKPQAIAQVALAGGGDAAKGRASSPLPYSALTSIGDDFEEKQKQLDALQQRQAAMLTQVRKQLAALPHYDPRQASQQKDFEEQEKKRKQLLKLLAEIEKRINEENARPKKRYISPATREEAFAVYYTELKSKIEAKGTANFPTHQGKKLYGELIMVITVNHDGRVLNTEVAYSSGNILLDQRAQAIARAAGPFGKFAYGMRLKADQLAVIARFKFTREETLETTVQ